MPSKDVKSNYPTCNRAFALRMMNPNSYSESRVSELDKEIQPVLKKPIAVSVFNDTERSNYEETSLSPSSSIASFQEMELHDIHENEIKQDFSKNSLFNGAKRQNSNVSRTINGKRVVNLTARHRFSSSPQNRNTTPKPNTHLSSSSPNRFEGNADSSVKRESLTRSASSSDGFNAFVRGTSARMSSPVKSRSKSSLSQGLVITAASHKNENGTNRSDVSKYFDVSGSNQKQTGQTSLRRSKSLRVSPNVPSLMRVKDKNGILTTMRHNTGRINIDKARQCPNVSDEFTESDSSTVFSEFDTYHLKSNPRTNSKVVSISKRNGVNTRHVLNTSIDTVMEIAKESEKDVASGKPNNTVHITNLDASADMFSSKLESVFKLITDKYPGDFQIIERLVEMQTAFEEQNMAVTATISHLRQRVMELEINRAKKSGNNLPSLVGPLMRATSDFQRQLQGILEREYVDVSTQIENGFPHESSPLDEISSEANLLVLEMEKHKANVSLEAVHQ